jgi:hypothetical protein
MTTDTPRTDAAREPYYDGKTSDWVHYTIAMMLERELAVSLENQCRAQAEVAALRTMAIELVKELLSKCDDPIHREQLASLSGTNSLQPSA